MARQDQHPEVRDIPGQAVLAARPRLDPARCRRKVSRCRRAASLGPMASPLRIRLALRIRSRGMVRGSGEYRTRDLPGRGRDRLRRMTIDVSPHPNRASAWILPGQADAFSTDATHVAHDALTLHRYNEMKEGYHDRR